MPIIKVDLRVTIDKTKQRLRSTTTDSSRLGYDPQFKMPKREIKASQPVGSMAEEEPDLIMPSDIVSACDKNLETADEVIEQLKKRCKHLVMKVDRATQGPLYDACLKLFKPFNGFINFDMYVQLLNHNNAICRQMRMMNNG